MFLDESEAQAIEVRVKALEAEFGVEVVTLVVGKADVYPETVWKAFALGAALTGLVVTIGDLLRPDWITGTAVLWSAAAILGVGALAGLTSVYVPAFARLFLRDSRATLEVSQYAKVQFLERELFATSSRTAVLLVVSLLERRVVILADKGLRNLVPAAEWDLAIAQMTQPLRAGQVGAAMLAGLDGIRSAFVGKGIARAAANVFGDTPIEDASP
jgi:putative membrane protein